jgi:hypothetical protein
MALTAPTAYVYEVKSNQSKSQGQTNKCAVLRQKRADLDVNCVGCNMPNRKLREFACSGNPVKRKAAPE